MKLKRIVVARVDDLDNGGMKAVEVGDTRVLLTRVGGDYHVVGGLCPHYGTPLDTGALRDGRVYCPWHHACFDAKDGALLEPPALEGLPSYDVEIDGEDVAILFPTGGKAGAPSRRLDRTPLPGEDRLTFVIAGGGAAGDAAARELRRQGFGGRVVMVTEDQHLPYDRPELSKGYLQGKTEKASLALGDEDDFTSSGIELRVGERVTSVDPSTGQVELAGGDRIDADRVLIATGGAARHTEVDGADLDGVFTLRSLADADAILAAAGEAKKAVVVGSGFIGMETAFSLSERGLEVTVVTTDSVPFESQLGREIGALFQKLHEDAGVRFEFGTRVAGFTGDGSVGGVTLEGGRQIPADLVVVGLGISPNAGGVAGVTTAEDGGIPVDNYLAATTDRVYAAGDVASFPYWVTGERVRIEHWRTAEQQGRVAARNMLGIGEAYRSVPFFWTTQAGLHFRYVGHATDWDRVVVDGDIDSKNFIAYYVKDDRVLAVAGNGRDEEMADIEARMRTGEIAPPSV